MQELHERCAYALQYLIAKEDEEDRKKQETAERAILICTHAASLIAVARALTGRMPADPAEEDFQTYTAGISKFTRRALPDRQEHVSSKKWEKGMEIPKIGWQNGKGVRGGWDCVLNSDCSHLTGGEERGW